MLRYSFIGLFLGMSAMAAPQSSTTVTFNKDILPILQKNCQGCHRPGEVAPMSLLTYTDARPWAKAIKAAVVARKMPPWFADPNYGHFANDPTLSSRDINALVTWVDNGAPEGAARDRPAPITFPDGWTIKPDMVIEMPKDFHVPATGTVNYQNILVKVNFPEDEWVVAAEMRPGNPQVVHHMRGQIRGPGSSWMRNAVPGEAYEAESDDGVMNKNEDGENLSRQVQSGVWAHRSSPRMARPSSCPKGPILFSTSTTPQSASLPRTDQRSGWYSRNILRLHVITPLTSHSRRIS